MENIKYITMKLDENERSTQIRSNEGKRYDGSAGSGRETSAGWIIIN
ncbi:hypothetical protein [Eubacterium ventriosum]